MSRKVSAEQRKILGTFRKDRPETPSAPAALPASAADVAELDARIIDARADVARIREGLGAVPLLSKRARKGISRANPLLGHLERAERRLSALLKARDRAHGSELPAMPVAPVKPSKWIYRMAEPDEYEGTEADFFYQWRPVRKTYSRFSGALIRQPEPGDSWWTPPPDAC